MNDFLITSLLLFSGIAVFGLSRWHSRSGRWRKIFRWFLRSLALLLLICGGYSGWYFYRPQPRPVKYETLFQGVTYHREIFDTPRPIVAHIVSIDVTAPGLRLFVTPPNPTQGHQLAARTTSQFADEFDVQVAINAGFFSPFFEHGPFSFYPHVGDPVNVFGLAIFEGQPYSPINPEYETFYIGRENQLAIGHALSEPHYAISGYWIFVKDGVPIQQVDTRYHADKPSPRTAVAIDEDSKTLLLFVVDGRQPNYSEGMTLPELADLAVKYGAFVGLNLDGGGSTTLVIQDEDGKPHIMNSPIHGRVPAGRERPVANHLGIFASPY